MSGYNEPSRKDYSSGEKEAHLRPECKYIRENRIVGQYILRRICWCAQYLPKEELHFSANCGWEQSTTFDPFKRMTVSVLTKVCECGGNSRQRGYYEPNQPWNEVQRR
uniref:Uncharacterized protein n=1 Tax=Branchiostoma floridae TaxID=7739 RepID=C3YCW4_BRAFL|eukprot:XP_002605905.1 hypothetical protein BRAFLDRAFT_87422 [Branchiostoma floridae]